MSRKFQFLIITLTGFISFALGQADQIDSSIYTHFSQLNYVKRVTYVKEFYINRQIKEEGWRVYYYNTKNVELPFIKNILPNEIVYANTGIWKRFYRNGILKNVDTIPQNWDKAWGSQTYFDKKGIICERDIIGTSNELPAAGWSDMKDGNQYVFIYYKNGKEVKRTILFNGKSVTANKKE